MKKRLSSLKTISTHPSVALVLRVGLGLVFIYASLDKIAHPFDFAENIAAYKMMPLWSINLMALTLPWIEIIAGIALILGFYTRGNLIIINGLLVIFIIAISQALIRGLSLSCGCFETGAEAEALGRATLYRDIVMLAAGIHIYLFDSSGWGLDRWLAKGYPRNR